MHEKMILLASPLLFKFSYLEFGFFIKVVKASYNGTNIMKITYIYIAKNS